MIKLFHESLIYININFLLYIIYLTFIISLKILNKKVSMYFLLLCGFPNNLGTFIK